MADALKQKYYAELAELRQQMADLQAPTVRSAQQARTVEKTGARVEQDPPMPAPRALSVVGGAERDASRGLWLSPQSGRPSDANVEGVAAVGGTTGEGATLSTAHPSQRSEAMPDLRNPNPYAAQIVDARRLVSNLTNLAVAWDRDHKHTRPDTAQGAWD